MMTEVEPRQCQSRQQVTRKRFKLNTSLTCHIMPYRYTGYIERQVSVLGLVPTTLD